MRFVIHENSWTWGKSLVVISSMAEATVELSFEDVNPGVCFLSGLSVLPEYRRQGIATELMRVCEQICEKRGIFRIDLNSVLTDYVQGFYKKLGYIPIKEDNGVMQMYKLLKK